MDVERRDMDYHIRLSIDEINVLCGYARINGIKPPIEAFVKGGFEGEVLVFDCTRLSNFKDNPHTFDHVLFEQGDSGPKVTTDPYALVILLGEREYWVTRYGLGDKVWIRREESEN